MIVAAHGLGHQVIAEGVEDAQGFLFSEALAGPRFTARLAQNAHFAP
jgi:EAL domain-containing protein (putative c-di-GMP-specific phosphodiesterase class I)